MYIRFEFEFSNSFRYPSPKSNSARAFAFPSLRLVKYEYDCECHIEKRIWWPTTDIACNRFRRRYVLASLQIASNSLCKIASGLITIKRLFLFSYQWLAAAGNPVEWLLPLPPKQNRTPKNIRLGSTGWRGTTKSCFQFNIKFDFYSSRKHRTKRRRRKKNHEERERERVKRK